MTDFAALSGLAELADLAPALRRAVSLDPGALVRLRLDDGRATAFISLPFRVLVARSLRLASAPERSDVTAAAGEWLAWLDGERPEAPQRCDAQWRGALPPASGWRRLDTVPEDVLRGLVRDGARTLADAAGDGGTPSAGVADSLLDAVVLTVTADDGGSSAEINLRTVSALVRMGFVPRGSQVAVEINGRWIRMVGAYGTAYAERPGMGLSLL